MAKYGSDAVTVEVDNAGGTPVDLSNYIDSVGDISISASVQETHAMGDSWVERTATGLMQAGAIDLVGFYDDTASTGPLAVLYGDGAALGATRTLKITLGGGKYVSCEAVITDFKRTISRGELTRFTATLLPTGVVTDA